MQVFAFFFFFVVLVNTMVQQLQKHLKNKKIISFQFKIHLTAYSRAFMLILCSSSFQTKNKVSHSKILNLWTNI